MDQKNSLVADQAGQRGYWNVEKHPVSFEEAATVFDDPMFITFVDDEHSIDEERHITVCRAAAVC